MVRVNWTCFVFLVYYLIVIVNSQDYYTPDSYNDNYPILTEHPGGTILDDVIVFTKLKSPYILRNDLIIERNAKVEIESGVEIRFEPQIGITVRGVLIAEVRYDFSSEFFNFIF